MSEWIGHTNQKLYQARLLIEAIEAEPQRPLTQALEESVLMQLWWAYQSYLHELASLVRCESHFDSLSELVAASSPVLGEMKELQHLESDTFSWLSNLSSALTSVQQPNKSSVMRPAAAGAVQIISTVDDTPSHNLWVWYQALSDLIDLQRENRQES